MDIISILEGLYLIYMYVFFKTVYSIHHPFEYMIVKNDLWKHPINTGQYENKICKIGTYASILGALLFLYRGIGYETSKKYTKWIIVIWLFVSLMTNINALIYVIPILLIEIFHYKLLG